MRSNLNGIPKRHPTPRSSSPRPRQAPPVWGPSGNLCFVSGMDEIHRSEKMRKVRKKASGGTMGENLALGCRFHLLFGARERQKCTFPIISLFSCFCPKRRAYSSTKYLEVGKEQKGAKKVARPLTFRVLRVLTPQNLKNDRSTSKSGDR